MIDVKMILGWFVIFRKLRKMLISANTCQTAREWWGFSKFSSI